jgi:hypothetical protein
MTFEEFKGLALNPPFSEERSVYRIDVFRIVEQEDGVDYYPRYGVRKRESFILPTFDEATDLFCPGKSQNMRRALFIAYISMNYHSVRT